MWKDYFSFTRREQHGLLGLMIIILILIAVRLIAPLLRPPFDPTTLVEDVTDIILLDDDGNADEENLYSFTPFNPNEVTFNQLINFGLTQQVADNWQKFIQKGGVFYRPEDVRKVYGLSESAYRELEPFIRIEGEDRRTNFEASKNHHSAPIYIDLNRVDSAHLAQFKLSANLHDSLLSYSKTYWFPNRVEQSNLAQWTMDSLLVLKPLLKLKREKITLPDVNISSADTTMLVILPGIGAVLSRRIIAYRNKIGGFVLPRQLLEVYGISAEVYENIKHYIVVDTLTVKTININKASVSKIREHPYFNFYQAEAISKERRKKGAFTSVNELLSLEEFKESDWEKIRHYLSVSDQ